MKIGKTGKRLCMLVILMFSVSLEAKFYKCTNANGKVSLQDRPCSKQEQAEKISVVVNNSNSRPHLNRIQNAYFDRGLALWEPRFATKAAAFRWINHDGHKRSGAIAVQSTPPPSPKKRVAYDAVLSQCVLLEQGRRYRFAASFKPMGQYKSRHANRVNLYWYQSEDCSSQGQFADYLEPDPKIYGWQRITHEHRLRSLNAKAALITIVQSRTTGNHQPAFWDDIELTPTEMEATKPVALTVNPKHTLPIGENYIHNGSFKLDLTAWRSNGDTTWVYQEGANAPGAARLAIFSDKGGLGANTLSQCVNIGANKMFRAGAKVKVDPLST